MNSLKRERLDSAVDVKPLDSESSVRVIGAHRRRSKIVFPTRRVMSALIVVLMLAPTVFIQSTTSARPTSPLAAPSVAPHSFPAAPYVAATSAPGSGSEIDTGPSVRASRDKPRAAEPVATPKPVSRVEVAVRFALAQQGDRYVWAASGPNSYDCSGLVMTAFRQIGINLPHYTGTMINRGTRINRASMQRGDVIFPSSGHVGIYLGDGMMVHASSSKGRVVVAKVYSFYAARRLA